MKTNSTRDLRFDVLKSLGICLVILAHVIPQNTILFQLRNFDVPLMVLVSGVLFNRSCQKKNYDYFPYLRKRIPRLILPVWCFLSIFFIAVALIESLRELAYPFDWQIIVGSFFLTNGITHLWIVRVFVLIAIVSPLLIKLRYKFKQERVFLGLIAIIYLSYELLLWLFTIFPKIETNNLFGYFVIDFLFYFVFWINIVFYVLPYGCVFCLGLVLEKFKLKQVLLLSFLFLAIFIGLAFHYFQLNGEFIPTQKYKVLPRLYYLSYGLSISLFAYWLVTKFEFITDTLNQKYPWIGEAIVFISSSTLWIFLWHLVGLQYISIWSLIFPKASHYLIRYVVVLLFSILLTLIQKIAIEQIIAKTTFGRQNAYLLKTLFLQ